MPCHATQRIVLLLVDACSWTRTPRVTRIWTCPRPTRSGRSVRPRISTGEQDGESARVLAAASRGHHQSQRTRRRGFSGVRSPRVVRPAASAARVSGLHDQNQQRHREQRARQPVDGGAGGGAASVLGLGGGGRRPEVTDDEWRRRAVPTCLRRGARRPHLRLPSTGTSLAPTSPPHSPPVVRLGVGRARVTIIPGSNAPVVDAADTHGSADGP